MRELRDLAASFRYAFRGIGYGIATQRNMRIHLTAVAVVVTANLMAQLSITHWCIEILCCMAVLSLELVNTAVESACNEISTEKRPGIGHAKDAAAGAVLVSAIGSVVIAVLIFFFGSESYFQNAAGCLSTVRWLKYALIFGAIAALVLIFLPSVLQKRKKP